MEVHPGARGLFAGNLGVGSTQGPCLEDPPDGHTADWVHSLSKGVQSLGYGRMETGGMFVGPGVVQGNDQTRAALGDQLVPMDLVLVGRHTVVPPLHNVVPIWDLVPWLASCECHFHVLCVAGPDPHRVARSPLSLPAGILFLAAGSCPHFHWQKQE